MTVTSALSHNAPLPLVSQTGESAACSGQPKAEDQQALAELVCGVRDAALNPAAVEQLAYAIAGQEGIPNKPYLANLLALLDSTSSTDTAANPYAESEDEAREAEEQESRHLSELRKQAEITRDRLRSALAAMEILRTTIRADTAVGRQCTRFTDAWQSAVTAMDDLLQPSLEIRLAQQPKEIADNLTALGANLRFQITEQQEPQHIAGTLPLA